MSEYPPPEKFAVIPDESEDFRRLKRIGIAVVLIALAVAIIGIGSRYLTTHRLATEGEKSAVPTVDYIRPAAGAVTSGVTLPGNVQAWNSAAIYARTNGYLRKWLADIGDKVSEGQPLAILDAPDLDQQLAQARADYQTALAQQALAGTTAQRWATMLKADAVSAQESDEKAGDFKAKTAVANASLANVKRLQALQGFTRLTAPFAGTVTSRSAEIGALVVSGTSAAQPLFTVSDVHRMRIYVRVPQGYSSQIGPGIHATMTLPEYPGRQFDAVLVRSAGAVDNASGAVLVELQTENPDGALKPGAFAQVNFPIRSAAGTVRIPSSALIFGDQGMTVAIVDRQGKVAIKQVVIARDLGKQLEISSGLSPQDHVINTPPDAIQTGDIVHAVFEPPAPGSKG
jgi:RND family efflux transporter MFP subunit